MYSYFKYLGFTVYNFYFIFRRRYLMINKKTDSENAPTQIHDFERRLSPQTR